MHHNGPTAGARAGAENGGFMNVRDLVKAWADHLVTSRPEDTIESAATLLSTNNIGALPVRDVDGRLVGVVSERDITRAVARHGVKALALRVADIMTHDVVTCGPDDSVKSVMETMTRRHIRHLPVVEKGELVAMLSQRDLMQALVEQTALELNVLRDYVHAKRS